MSNRLKDVLDKPKKNKEGNEGKVVRSYSKKHAAKTLTTILNAPDQGIDSPKMKDGKKIVETIYPAKMFRNYLTDVFVDACGGDKNEIKGIMATYEFKDAEPVVPFVQLAAYQVALEKKFDLIPTENFSGGFIIEEVGKTISEYTAPSTGEKGKIEKQAHLRLKAKPKMQIWLKRKL